MIFKYEFVFNKFDRCLYAKVVGDDYIIMGMKISGTDRGIYTIIFIAFD